MDDSLLKKGLKASYTVEAAFVMSLVLWGVISSVQTAFRMRDVVVGSMALGEAAERLRHGEGELPEEAAAVGMDRAGHSFSWDETRMEMKRSGNFLTGRAVYGMAQGGAWKLELELPVFDPENFLRKLSLLEQEE